MADERRTKFKDKTHLPDLKLDAKDEASDPAKGSLTPVQNFLKRREEVTQKDQREFSEYVREKSARDRQQSAVPADSSRVRSRLNRRSVLKWVAGTAAVGEGVALGYQMMTDGDIPAHGVMHSGATSTEARRHYIERQLIDPLADMRGRRFGNWVLLMPTKLGGGTY